MQSAEDKRMRDKIGQVFGCVAYVTVMIWMDIWESVRKDKLKALLILWGLGTVAYCVHLMLGAIYG
jgi:hypothetical protein